MLGHRDVSAIMGLNRSTSLWELWHFSKGTCERSKGESSRSFWGHNLRPHVLAGLQKRYDCVLAPSEIRMTHGCVYASAARILEHGTLPVGSATHIVIEMISSEAFANTYAKSDKEYLPTDLVHASIAHTAFDVEEIAFFLFIGNGEQEKFFNMARSEQTDTAVKDAVDKFLHFVQRDIEPEPDFELDYGRLAMFAASSPNAEDAYEADDNPDFMEQLRQYKLLSKEKSALESKSREIEKERSALKGMLAHQMSGHSRARCGDNVIEFKLETRNVTARVDTFTRLNVK